MSLYTIFVITLLLASGFVAGKVIDEFILGRLFSQKAIQGKRRLLELKGLNSEKEKESERISEEAHRLRLKSWDRIFSSNVDPSGTGRNGLDVLPKYSGSKMRRD